jgi:hypothetical protein
VSTPLTSTLACGRTGCTGAVVVQWQRRVSVGVTAPVYACAVHSVTIALAAQVHNATCGGPNSAALPTCDCTPEPLPVGVDPTNPALPDGW